MNILDRNELAKIVGGSYQGSDGNTWFTASEHNSMIAESTWAGGLVQDLGYVRTDFTVQASDMGFSDYYNSIGEIVFYGYDNTDGAGCLNRCKDMLQSLGCETADVDDSSNIQMTKYNSNGYLTTQSEISDGITLIDNTLSGGKPIIVGADYKSGHTGNYD